MCFYFLDSPEGLNSPEALSKDPIQRSTVDLTITMANLNLLNVQSYFLRRHLSNHGLSNHGLTLIHHVLNESNISLTHTEIFTQPQDLHLNILKTHRHTRFKTYSLSNQTHTDCERESQSNKFLRDRHSLVY